MSESNEYRTIIQRFAKDRVNARVPNGLPMHASALLECMFDNATAEMRIYSGKLIHSVYSGEGIEKAAIKFLSRPYASLKILLQHKVTPSEIADHPLLVRLSEVKPRGSLIIRNAVGSYAKEDTNHFAVMDNDGFRYELDHGNCEAVANFNEPDTAKILVQAFDAAFRFSGMKSGPLFELSPCQ